MATLNQKVNIYGLGACTSIGFNAPMTAASARAGICRFAEHPFMLDEKAEPVCMAVASYLSHDINGIERYLALGLPAAEEALAGTKTDYRSELDIIIGLPAYRPGLPANLEEHIRQSFQNTFQERFRLREIKIISTGHAAGLMAMQEARQRVQQNPSALCLAGGIDTYLEPDTLAWLEKNEQLYTEDNAWGFIPGEGAGFSLLGSEQTAKQYDLKPCGSLLAIATAHEKNLIKTDTVCTGEGLTQAVQEALQVFGDNKTLIDYMICDLNSEPYRAKEISHALVRIGEYFKDATDFISLYDCWGDVGAASGPLFIILAVISGLRGYAKGPHILVTTSSESGERCAGIIETCTKEKV